MTLRVTAQILASEASVISAWQRARAEPRVPRVRGVILQAGELGLIEFIHDDLIADLNLGLATVASFRCE